MQQFVNVKLKYAVQRSFTRFSNTAEMYTGSQWRISSTPLLYHLVTRMLPILRLLCNYWLSHLLTIPTSVPPTLFPAAECSIHSQGRATDWWRRMARISLDCPVSLPGIPLSVLSVPMENKYKCQQCLLVLRKPVQAQCGHRFCVHCFRQLTR